MLLPAKARMTERAVNKMLIVWAPSHVMLVGRLVPRMHGFLVHAFSKPETNVVMGKYNCTAV